jgi:catechol 2,3-dioxygenase-like lactoylglutathione lyase family enzyme
VTAARVSFASVLAQDMERLSAFYGGLFDLPEVGSLRSELFRGLLAGSLIVGFSHPDAASLLELPDGRDRPGQQFLTFEADSAEAVGELTGRAVAAGATLVQAPHTTYYGATQSVLADPEGNPFRINHLVVAEVDAAP